MNKTMSWLRNIFTFDLRSLALFRIGLALLLLGDLFVRATDLVAHYTDFGVLPRSAVLGEFLNQWHLSLNFIGGTATFQIILFAIYALFLILLLVGYRTKLVTVICWIFLISIHSRNPIILQGGDILLHMLLFWAMFLPLNAYASIDSALNNSKKATPTRYVSFATAAYTLQIMIVYWFSVIYKTGSEWWPDGTAVYYALNADHHATAFGKWMLEAFSPQVLQALTYLTLAMEVTIPIMLLLTAFFGRARLILLGAIAILHFSFSLALDIGIFPWVNAVSLLIFIPAWYWEKVGKSARISTRKLSIYYDGQCGFCQKVTHLLKTFLFLSGSTLLPAQTSRRAAQAMKRFNSWVVADEKGKIHVKFNALILLVERSPVWWPLARILKWKWLRKKGVKYYEHIANHRAEASQHLRWAVFRPLSFKPTKIGNALATFFIAYIFLWNIGDLPQQAGITRFQSIHIPPSLAWVGHTFRVDQQWNMFSPAPFKDDGWFVIPGTLVDGRQIDLLTGNEPPIYEKPPLVSALFKNSHWEKYFRNISNVDKEAYRLYFGRYLCRDWNSQNVGGNQLKSLQLIFMKEWTLPDYQASAPQKEVLWNHECF